MNKLTHYFRKLFNKPKIYLITSNDYTEIYRLYGHRFILIDNHINEKEYNYCIKLYFKIKDYEYYKIEHSSNITVFYHK